MGRPFTFPDRTIVVTGGANGIGYALAERFGREPRATSSTSPTPKR